MTVRAALITGRHSFDVMGLYDALRTLDGIVVYPQHLEHFGSTPPEARRNYDVLVFYNFHQETPTAEEPWYEAGTMAAFEELGESHQGIFVLHHGLVAFPGWALWSEICGIEKRKADVTFGERLRIDVVDPAHPITRGMSSFEIVDETYLMPSAGPDSTVLLTTDHPRSMRTIAWTRRYKSSPVFCLQSGHDAQAYNCPGFGAVFGNAVRWLAEAR